MLDSQTLAMMAEGTGATLYMTLMSTLFGYILGLPMGIILVVTAPKGLRPNQVVYRILDVIVNITRSIPFLILMILIMPFTRILVGKTYGTTATIVPTNSTRRTSRNSARQWPRNWASLCLRQRPLPRRTPRKRKSKGPSDYNNS